MEKAVRTRFWYKKLFLGIFGVVLSNAYILWRSQPACNVKGRAELHHEFYNKLMQQLCGAAPERRTSQPAHSDELRLNVGVQHYLEKVETDKQSRAHNRCVMCVRNGKEARTCLRCDKCKVFLCGPHTGRDCFRKYHTLPVLPEITKKVVCVNEQQKRGPGRPKKITDK
jgi:hypothetical protein